MTAPVTYSNEGLRVTVNDFINDPLLVRARMQQLLSQQFIMERVLRDAGGNSSGVVRFEESAPLFLNDEPEVVAEGAEIPLGVGAEGTPKSAYTVKTALGIEITREARDRNRVDLVNRRMVQVRNTFTRHWERRLFAKFKSVAPTVAAATAWLTSTTLRDDIASAIETVGEAKAGAQDDDFLDFNPDTMIIPQQIQFDMLRNDTWARLYELGEKVEDHPQYTHQLERTIMGLTVLTSRFLKPADGVFILESKTVGGYSDERPLQTTPLYEDQNREVWRANTVRRTAVFIDQPKAVVRITGV